MFMSMECAFDPPVLTEEVHHQLQQLDSYADPCLLFLYADHTEQWRHKIIVDTLQAEHVSLTEIHPVSKNISFCLCYCEPTTVQVIADEIVSAAASDDMTAYLSIFRHNSLSIPEETFSWGAAQLNHLMDSGEVNSNSAINDFHDKVNWPGIAQYQQNHHVLKKTVKDTKRSGLVSGIMRLFGFGDKQARKLGFELTPMLSMIQGFVTSLPNGQALWAYVQTGEGREQLEKSNALIDLDHVLLLTHTFHSTPEFYDYILSQLYHDGIVEQNEIQQYFYRIIAELAEELLEAENKKAKKQGCFLRILDIFYHIFDQQPWPDEIYELLVEDEDTVCIDDEAYQARFVEMLESAAGGVSAKLKQQILELLDNLEDYHFASYQQWRAIEKLFKGNREAINPENWQGIEPTSRLLLASILLYKDRQSGINDSNTEALCALVDESLQDQVLEKISGELARGRKLPKPFVTWLCSEQHYIDNECIDQLAKCLAEDNGYNAHKTKGSAQPYTQLFSNISEFQPVLASCYWLQLCEPNSIAEKVIAMALRIAPQATLSCFINLQIKGSSTVADLKQKEQILANLKQVNADPYDVLALEVRLAPSNDIQWYEKLIKQYISMTRAEQLLWDNALAKVTPTTRDYFYLNVYRLAPEVVTPLLGQRQNMLKELVDSTLYFDDDFIAAHFSQKEVIFSGHIELLPEQLALPVSLHSDVISIENDMSLAIFLYHGEHLTLIAKTSEVEFDAESQSTSYANSYLVLDNQIDLEKLADIASQFENYQQRAKTLCEGMTSYLAGICSFSEYQTQFGCYSNTKQYDLQIENYSKYSSRILPQILAEPDEQVKLRLIKLLCSHRVRGARVLKDIAEQLFFDHYLTNGSADFEMRHSNGLAVEDLTDDWIETWKVFHTALSAKVAKLD